GQQPVAGRRHHHGIEDVVGQPPPGDALRDRFDELRRAEHPRLHGLWGQVVGEGVELLRHQRRGERLPRAHADGVLRRHRRDHARAEDAELVERLEVGLNPGAAARIRARNGERGLHVGHARAGPARSLDAELGRPAVPVEQATARVFASLAATETPQGIIAVVEPRAWTLADIAWTGGGGGAALVIDAVQDPGNVGTLIRTAHALGAAGTIALRGTADPLSPKALRAAMGATFRHPVVALDDPRFIAWTRQHGVPLGAAEADGA